MHFDVFTIAALVREFNEILVGGKVQDTLELGSEALGLEIYAAHQRQYLIVSADQQTARVHLVRERVRRGVENPSPIGLMLRRYVEGGRFVSASQPDWERVMRLEFVGAEGALTLIAEPMERRGNILLLRDGIIMDCVRRVGADENRFRVSLPGHPYNPPPPQSLKRAPTTLTLADLSERLDADPGKLAWRVLTESLLGFSPTLAKEVIYRAAGRVDGVRAGDVSTRALLGVIDGLVGALMAGQFTPGVCRQNGAITAFAAYELTFLPGWEKRESMSAALADYYGAPVGEEAYENAKAPVRAQLNEALEKVSRRVESLQQQTRDDRERERLRQSGELILAYQYQVGKGQTMLSAQYDFDAPPLEIAIDPRLTSVENAKAYFERYEKAKRAAAEIPALLKAAQAELDYLRQLDTDVTLAANYPEIGEVQEILQAHGYWRGARHAHPRGGKSAPLKIATGEGFVIWVGRNSRQNDEVTFGKGRPEDIWLHARGVPGAHVIIKSGGRSVPLGVLQRAANLAAYYSASRAEGRVLVDVTERRHVRKMRGGKAGMVTYRNEQPMEAIPAEAKTEKADTTTTPR
ncbi:MAG TPA: NFACT family protein [Aggregatilineales bacterium]|nr:NFACT family protein [Aggregatilineales bacterium]